MNLLTTLTVLSTAALSLAAPLEERDNALAARAATICGSGYELATAIPLPEGTDPDQRLGTLYSYIGEYGCLILDNNVGESEYMYLSLCEWDGSNCKKDTGYYSQYAGPLYLNNFACAKVTAKMGSSSSDLYIDYADENVFPCE
ncbi:hypothetical protein BDV59DRAFT_717 [Aspergillus ambiguus]|uniref:uncharacterized protein n=1 Tax=Aspergillus ambiguus TaxID=176160 RepID=UPI003CCCC74A